MLLYSLIKFSNMTYIIFILIILMNCHWSLNNQTSSEVYDNEAAFESEPNCMNWNVTVYIGSNSNKRNVQIRFRIFQKYQKCFAFYEVYLYRLWSGHFKHCDAYRGTRFKMAVVKEQHGQVASATFSELRNGYYCVLILPCTNYACLGSWSLHSDVVHIHEMKNRLQAEATSNDISIAELVAVILILTFAFGGGIWIYWKCKSRKQKEKAAQRVIREIEEVPFLPVQDTTVYIFYPHDEGTKRKVFWLKDFLKNAAGYEVILDEDVLDEILNNPTIWVDQTLRYKCSKTNGSCDSNKRFIIVQSESVFTYELNALSRGGRRYSMTSSNSSEDEMEDSWFRYALNSISIDWSKGLKDYCHLFVVCFDDDLCYRDEQINITKDRRYTIPDQVIDLCVDLNRMFENTSLKEQLISRLKEHPIRYL